MTEIRTIVTHPGPAHRDDLLAVAILLATPEGGGATVCRREPTPADLDNPTIAVVDVGGRHEPDRLNFDHHQFARDQFTPCCALTLVLRHLGLEDLARELWPWFAQTELNDSKGPRAAAQVLGVTPEQTLPLMSPVEGWFLRWFSERGPETITYTDSEDQLGWALAALGKDLLYGLHRTAERLKVLDKQADIVHVGPVCVVDATFVPSDKQPTLGLELWCKQTEKLRGTESGDLAVTVTQDDRGDGLCLFRRNDHPAVDFSRLESLRDIAFAHKNGFVAKTRPGADWRELVRLALV